MPDERDVTVELASAGVPVATARSAGPGVAHDHEATATVTPAPGSVSDDAAGLAPGTKIGRYEIVDVLGSGGMGVVYRARDPHLSRDVAIKLLRAGTKGEISQHHGRLLREAQALAKLSHPNVVAAFDVGTHDGAVFVAMELVEGLSLRDWLRATTRDRREILRVLIAAGRGLAAAHAAEVMHRDFKPGNVMVSSDGRTRVVDFGLARATGRDDADGGGQDPPTPDEPGATSSVSLLSSDLTRAGAIVGTPGYMAPEQLHRLPTSASADQFSFAVTAFVALTGKAAFRCHNVESYQNALVRGERTPWPRSVPRAIRRILDRGMAMRPEDRYPSLTALVDDLARAAAPRRWAYAAVAAIALGAGIAVAGVGGGGGATCEIDSQPIDAVWNAPARGAVERAFSATGRAHAVESFLRVSRELDAFRERWLAARQTACDAARVRGEQSEQVLALRSTCLDRKLAQFGTFVQLFARADARRVDDATGMIRDLPDLDACADVAALTGAADRLPRDPIARASIAMLESQLDLAETLEVAGTWEDAQQLADRVAIRAAQAKAPASEARAMMVAGELLNLRGKSEAARSKLQAAIALGARNGLDELVATAAIRLLASLVHDQRIVEAKAALPMIDAAVLRAGDPPRLRAQLLDRHGVLLALDQQWPAAIEMLEAAIAACDRLGPERCVATQIHTHANTELGNIYVSQRKFDLARAKYKLEIEESKRTFGPESPRVLLAYNNLANAEASAGTIDAALATLAESRKLASTLPKDHPLAVYAPAIEAQLWLSANQCGKALPLFEESLERWSAVWGPESYRVAQVSYLYAICLDEVGRDDAALAAVRRSTAIAAKLGSPGAERAEMELLEGQFLYKQPAHRAAGLAMVYKSLAILREAKNTMVTNDIEAWLAKNGQPLTAPAVSPPPK